MNENGIPRRRQLNRLDESELSIHNAMEEVEKVGADILLTDTINLLSSAREKLADFFDKENDLWVRKFNFGIVIQSLKLGKKVARQGWNRKGNWQESSDCPNGWNETTMWLELSDYPNGAMYKNFPLQPYILIKTTDDKFVPWVASQSDILAEDWLILPD